MATTKVSLSRQTDLNAAGSVITNVGTPVSATDAANKSYVDGLASGVDWKGSVRAGTTAAGTLATSFANGQSIDGVTLATNDRILIKNQASGAENGIYTVNASGAPTRAIDADGAGEITPNMAVFIEEGTTLADSGWKLTNDGSIVIGTTALVYTQFTGLGDVTVDTTLTKTGNQLSRSAITGDVAVPAGSNASTIGNNVVSYAKMQQVAANRVLGNITGSTSNVAEVALTSAATATTVVSRDANANTRFNSVNENLTATATAGGTTTLTVGSAAQQVFTGTTTQTVVMPDATTLGVGQSFSIANESTGVVTVNANGGGLLRAIAPGGMLTLVAVTVGTAAGTWDQGYYVSGASVQSVAVATANGFGGSVANPTGAASITITTGVTGLLKGNGTGVTAATAGTDYVAPATFVDRETPSGTINGSNTAFTLANTPIAGSEHVYLNGLLQDPGAGNDYTISAAAITMLSAPLTGDKIRVTYRK